MKTQLTPEDLAAWRNKRPVKNGFAETSTLPPAPPVSAAPAPVLAVPKPVSEPAASVGERRPQYAVARAAVFAANLDLLERLELSVDMLKPLASDAVLFQLISQLVKGAVLEKCDCLNPAELAHWENSLIAALHAYAAAEAFDGASGTRYCVGCEAERCGMFRAEVLGEGKDD